LPTKPKVCANIKCQSKYWDRPRKPKCHCYKCGHDWNPKDWTTRIPQHCPACKAYSWRERHFSPEEKLWQALTGSKDNVHPEWLVLPSLERVLRPRERTVILLHYGLDGNGTRTFKTIGNMFGVTGQRIYQIEAKSLRKLRRDWRDWRAHLASVEEGQDALEVELPEITKKELKNKGEARKEGINYEYFEGYGDGWEQSQQAMIKAGYRKETK